MGVGMLTIHSLVTVGCKLWFNDFYNAENTLVVIPTEYNSTTTFTTFSMWTQKLMHHIRLYILNEPESYYISRKPYMYINNVNQIKASM